MPVDDQDPAYRLVDSDTGDIVGTVYGTNSGDLAVQNESGTETLFTDDGIETPALKTEALETDDLKTVNIGPWDSTADKQFLNSEADENDVYHRGYAVYTENVTSTAERIGDAETRGGMAYVVGGDGSSPVFVDVLVYAAAGSVTVLGDAGRNSPVSRSYLIDGQDLMLAMGNDDGYDVTCVTLSGRYGA